MLAPIIFFLPFLALVSAAAIEKRLILPELVQVSSCQTKFKGTLTTANGHTVSLSSQGLTFGSSKLQVEFQQCKPNFGGFNGANGGPIGGHLVVNNKCLNIRYPYTSPPFAVVPVSCYYSDDSGQIFSNVVRKNDGTIYFVGDTQENGSLTFFNNQCKSGYFGLSSTAKSGAVELQCADNHNVVGFVLK